MLCMEILPWHRGTLVFYLPLQANFKYEVQFEFNYGLPVYGLPVLHVHLPSCSFVQWADAHMTSICISSYELFHMDVVCHLLICDALLIFCRWSAYSVMGKYIEKFSCGVCHFFYHIDCLSICHHINCHLICCGCPNFCHLCVVCHIKCRSNGSLQWQ